MTAFFTAFVDDPAYAAILSEADGACAVWAFSLPGGRWLIGCHSVDGAQPWGFVQGCQRALLDAERVEALLEGVDLVFDWE